MLNHFSKLFGPPPSRAETLNWENLGLPRVNLDHLEEEFSEEEIHAVVKELKSDKAPGPDGFIGIFYKSSWGVIKENLKAAINFFYAQHDQHFKRLNSAHVVLIPKKSDAICVGDYRPISLTHSVAKLVSKLMANQLAGSLDLLVSRTQSAFSKRRNIHDNFLYTQNLIKELHRAKYPALFLKLDIAKAFDSVRWDYLLEVLTQMGFGVKWRSWVSILLGSTSSAVFLNGARGKWFRHRRGLRLGDPLSPMLFILAMEPLHRLLELATSNGSLTPIAHRCAKLRISMYADDAAIFLNLVMEEVRELASLLSTFGLASGLVVNINKSACFPIRCEDLDVPHIMQFFNCSIKSFPCTYLGLPLHFRKLGRVEVQPLIEKVAARLPGWKGRLLNKAGRLRLVNAVLTSIPVHFLSVFALKKWALKWIDRVRRSFLWKGAVDANGGTLLGTVDQNKPPKKILWAWYSRLGVVQQGLAFEMALVRMGRTRPTLGGH